VVEEPQATTPPEDFWQASYEPPVEVAEISHAISGKMTDTTKTLSRLDIVGMRHEDNERS